MYLSLILEKEQTHFLNRDRIFFSFWSAKGQIISKGLFVILEFSQKTNERIQRNSKNEFVRSFFGRIRGYQKSFRNYLTFNNAKKLSIFSWKL